MLICLVTMIILVCEFESMAKLIAWQAVINKSQIYKIVHKCELL